MNIYKLQKLAAVWREFDSLAFHAPWPKRVPKKNHTVRYIDKCKAANMDFTRHCRNNFMRALGALKNEHKYHCDLEPDCSGCALIAELEEVK